MQQPRLVTFAELKPAYGIPYCRDHLRRLVKAGKFPKPRPIGPGRMGWIESDITAHIAAIADQPPIDAMPPRSPKPQPAKRGKRRAAG